MEEKQVYQDNMDTDIEEAQDCRDDRDAHEGEPRHDAQENEFRQDAQEDEFRYDDPEVKSGRAAGRRRSWIPFTAGFLSACIVLVVLMPLTGTEHLVSDKDWKYLKNLDTAYGKYYEVARLIGEDPLAETDPEEITDDDIREMIEKTGDPYAEYFTKEEYEEFEKNYSGEFYGIGIGIVQEDDRIVIKTVYKDSPADEAGIQPEDEIVRVGETVPVDVNDAVSMITGEAGTEVSVTVRRGREEISMTMTRARIDQETVGYSELEDHPDIGYIRITSFIHGTDKDFRLAVRDLRNKGCDKFILDLRNNGGGLTDVSINIADYLLPACKIMTDVRKDGTETVYNSKASSAELDLAVLVNEHTASASEILTGALQDNKACVVIGTNTYGKGVTQATHRFRDGSAVKLTVSEYFRPNGSKVHGRGITPDVDASDEEALDAAVRELTE